MDLLVIILFLFFLVVGWLLLKKQSSNKTTQGPTSTQLGTVSKRAQVTIDPFDEGSISNFLPGHRNENIDSKEEEESWLEDNLISYYNNTAPQYANENCASSAYNPVNKDFSSVKRVPSDLRFKIAGEFEGYKYHALFTYYPENKYKLAPTEVLKDRKTIYGFKDGMNWQAVADMISDALVNEYTTKKKNWNVEKVVLVVIPSSTKSNNYKRYELFCQRVSNNLDIANGFKAINIVKDREALKGKKGIDKIANLNYNLALVENKYVFLFDDVKTTGASFLQNANELMRLGAKEVRGLFIGETYNSSKHGNPNWAPAECQPLSSLYRKTTELPF